MDTKIVDVDAWQPWQMRLAGASMAWWLALAPALLGWAWKRSHGAAPLPGALDWLGVASCGLLLLGVLQALFTAGASDSPQARCVAWWFLIGALLSPIAVGVFVAWMR